MKISFAQLLVKYSEHNLELPINVANRIRNWLKFTRAKYVGLFEQVGGERWVLSPIGTNCSLKQLPRSPVHFGDMDQSYRLISYVTDKDIRDDLSLVIPDIDSGSHMIGGDSDNCYPLIASYSPCFECKREVKVHTMTWCGTTAFDAKHITVQLEPKDAYLWDWVEGCWRHPHKYNPDVPKLAIPYKTASWLYYSEFEDKLVRWVRGNCKKHFPPSEFFYRDDNKTWFDPLEYTYER